MVLDEWSEDLVARVGFCAANASDLGWAVWPLLCLISFVLRLQDNFCSFVTIAIEWFPTKFGIHRNIYIVAAAVYFSHNHFSNRPTLKMTKYLLSYSYACLHYCRSCSLSSISLTLLGRS